MRNSHALFAIFLCVPPEQTAALLKGDVARYGRIIKAANIKSE